MKYTLIFRISLVLLGLMGVSQSGYAMNLNSGNYSFRKFDEFNAKRLNKSQKQVDTKPPIGLMELIQQRMKGLTDIACNEKTTEVTLTKHLQEKNYDPKELGKGLLALVQTENTNRSLLIKHLLENFDVSLAARTETGYNALSLLVLRHYDIKSTLCLMLYGLHEENNCSQPFIATTSTVKKSLTEAVMAKKENIVKKCQERGYQQLLATCKAYEKIYQDITNGSNAKESDLDVLKSISKEHFPDEIRKHEQEVALIAQQQLLESQAQTSEKKRSIPVPKPPRRRTRFKYEPYQAPQPIVSKITQEVRPEVTVLPPQIKKTYEIASISKTLELRMRANTDAFLKRIERMEERQEKEEEEENRKQGALSPRQSKQQRKPLQIIIIKRNEAELAEEYEKLPKESALTLALAKPKSGQSTFRTMQIRKLAQDPKTTVHKFRHYLQNKNNSPSELGQALLAAIESKNVNACDFIQLLIAHDASVAELTPTGDNALSLLLLKKHDIRSTVYLLACAASKNTFCEPFCLLNDGKEKKKQLLSVALEGDKKGIKMYEQLHKLALLAEHLWENRPNLTEDDDTTLSALFCQFFPQDKPKVQEPVKQEPIVLDEKKSPEQDMELEKKSPLQEEMLFEMDLSE